MGETAKQLRASKAAKSTTSRLLDAARIVFLENGYQGASMDAVAREARSSKGTLYAHFVGKESLFAAVVSRECQRQAWTLTKLGGEDLPIGLALRQIGMCFIDFLLSPDVVALHRVIVAEAQHFPDLGRAFFECGPAKVQSIVTELLNRPAIRRELTIPDTEVAAELFLALVKGQLRMRSELGYPSPDAAERNRWMDVALDFFVAGYGASTGPHALTSVVPNSRSDAIGRSR